MMQRAGFHRHVGAENILSSVDAALRRARRGSGRYSDDELVTSRRVMTVESTVAPVREMVSRYS